MFTRLLSCFKLPTFIWIILSLFFFSHQAQATHSEEAIHRVALVLPISHRALDHIAQALTQELSDTGLSVEVFNALGDVNTLQSILLRLKSNKDYGIIVPVGTRVTDMATKTIKDKPIVGLSTTYSEEDRLALQKKKKQYNLTYIQEEQNSELLLQAASIYKPGKKRVALVHSNETKLLPNIHRIKSRASEENIELQNVSVATMADVYSVVHSVKGKADLIIILKDHLIASAIGVINSIAREDKNNPALVITSDEGSVKAGADIAIGVKEADLGTEGGKLIKEILNGRNIRDIPVVSLQNRLVLFFNPKGSLSESRAQDIADKLQLQLVTLSPDE